jgi:hypothetical protein
MRSDYNLIREILIAVEDTPANREPDIDLPNRDRDTVLEHLELLIDKGLLEGHIQKSGMGDERILAVNVIRMTALGHDFIKAARNEAVWSKVMKTIKEKGSSAPFEILQALLKRAATEHFFGPSS